MAEIIEQLAGLHEELLSALLDQSHECIKLLDAEGRILFVNREGCTAMELSAPGDILGQPWASRWPEESRILAENAFHTVSKGDVARFSAPRVDSSGFVRWWDVTITPVASSGAARFLTIARDVTAEVREKERVAAISAEMRHRLKNAMTIAAGIVTLEARSNPAHQSFARSVCERFGQLGHVQDLVLDPSREKHLAQVLALLAGVYGGGTLLEIGALPDVRLEDAATQALALTFGELATNSLKYGALAAAKTIAINASVEDGFLHLIWREPTIFGPTRDGAQGSRLVERLLAAAGGSVVREITRGSLVVRVSLPISA